MGFSLSIGHRVCHCVCLSQNQGRCELSLLWFALDQGLGLVTHPALDHLILRVELDPDHSLVTPAIKKLVRAALHLVVLLRAHLALQAVAEVRLVLRLVPARQIHYDGLIVNERPGALLARPGALGAVEDFGGEVGLEQQVKLGGLPGQRELQRTFSDLQSILKCNREWLVSILIG